MTPLYMWIHPYRGVLTRILVDLPGKKCCAISLAFVIKSSTLKPLCGKHLNISLLSKPVYTALMCKWCFSKYVFLPKRNLTPLHNFFCHKYLLSLILSKNRTITLNVYEFSFFFIFQTSHYFAKTIVIQLLM